MTDILYDLVFLQELLDHASSKSLINKGDIYEDTPLHVAAEKGFVVVAEVEYLVVTMIYLFQ